MKPHPNQLEAVEVHIAPTRAIVDCVDQLVATGLYGFNRADCIERLLAEKVRQLAPPVILRRFR